MGARAALLGVALGLAAPPAPAEPVGGTAPGDRLSGRDIYARVLDNRFRSFVQDARLVSGQRGGREQESRLRMFWLDFRSGEAAKGGVLSKTLVQYSHPFDIRHSGYLIIQNESRENDQFVYSPARRKIVRVQLRGQPVFGTDFSYEDIVPRELQDATYRRLPDEALEGVAVFVVEARPTEIAKSQYSRFRIYVDRERYVTLRVRYWDRAGVESKELRAVASEVREFDGVWVPLRSTMHSRQLDSYTTLVISNLMPNPDLPESTFDLRRLESH